MGKNDFLPEIHFISRLKEGDHESQSVSAGHMGNMKKPTYEEKEFLKRSDPQVPGQPSPISKVGKE